jgi:2-(1,2-epoxy-1,2-dihydrophenyl)acetyl-CoA isomerase
LTPVELDVTDGVARLRLNRPEAGNSVDPALAAALAGHAASLEGRDDVRVVVLGAAGRAFCVGGDLGYFASADDPERAIHALADGVHAAERSLAAIDAPVVCRVQGAAAGIGFSLVCAADIVIAGASASFTAAYGAVGLSPDGGQSWTLPRLVGARRAAELILTNRRVGAEEAAGIGLITEVVADEELDDRVAAVAARLAASSLPAMGAAKRLLAASATTPFDAHLEVEADTIAALAAGPDGREGVAAFLAKRRPSFGGAG